jgi:hypothetical protein
VRTIIAGGRDIQDPQLVESAMQWAAYYVGITPTTVVSGGCRGVDQLGEAWARQRGIRVERYPADWNRYKKKAGPIRNGVMAENSAALVALWNGKSRGTEDMIRKAYSHGLRVFIFYTDRT